MSYSERDTKQITEINTVLYWPAHDVAQFLQVAGSEVIVVAIAALDIFVYSVQVQRHRVQQLNLLISTALDSKQL